MTRERWGTAMRARRRIHVRLRPEHQEILCALVFADWHRCREDVVSALVMSRTPEGGIAAQRACGPSLCWSALVSLKCNAETLGDRAPTLRLDPADCGPNGSRLALVTRYPFPGVLHSAWR
jgi:hypothetical protein